MYEPNQTHFADSPLNFEVAKTPLTATLPDGDARPVKDKVGLTRTDTGETIAIVGKGFGLVQNADLFDKIDDEVFQSVGDEHRKTAIIKDRIAKRGALCTREYAFPDIKMDGDDGGKKSGMFERGEDGVTDLGFRLLVSNGFGGSSLAVHAGAIDFYCTNGMVLGKLNSAFQVRHTRKVEINMGGMGSAVRDSIDMFNGYADTFERYVLSPITDAIAQLTLTESLAFSKALTQKIYEQYLLEKAVRGANMWALLSAATYYASHFNGAFAARNTGNDHIASTMMMRQRKVGVLVNSDAFQSALR